MTEREKIAARIRALRAKTVANGCTEGEAMAAAQKAAQLLADYNLTVDEVEMRASPFAEESSHHSDDVGERLWKVADGVATLTGTTYWRSRPGVRPVGITFFGFAHEVEIATYLLELCAGAMRREQERILHGPFPKAVTYRQRQALFPFLDGMADRLRVRLIAMKPPEPTGTGLVVLKKSLIEQALPHKLQSSGARPSRNADSGYADGLAAGDKVALNPALATAQGQQQIGHRQ